MSYSLDNKESKLPVYKSDNRGGMYADSRSARNE